jgi:copper chaperone CopZ
MKKILLLLCILFSLGAQAEVTKVSIQASGLTCSMCSKAIYKALKALDFVAGVEANIKNSSFDVAIKPGTVADFDKMKAAVEDAGFAVAAFFAKVHFDNVQADADAHVVVDGRTLHFLNTKRQLLNGDKTIRVVDKGFVSSKEYKKNKVFTKMKCYDTGVAGDCCTKGGLAAGSRIYHVTI